MRLAVVSIKISPSARLRLADFHASLCVDPVRSIHGAFTLSHAFRVALYRALCHWRARHPEVSLLTAPLQKSSKRGKTLPVEYTKTTIQVPRSLLYLLDTYAHHSGMSRSDALRDALDKGLDL